MDISEDRESTLMELCVTPEDLMHVSQAGILEQKGPHETSGWHRRLIIIQFNMLYIYARPKENPLDIICLDECEVTPGDAPSPRSRKLSGKSKSGKFSKKSKSSRKSKDDEEEYLHAFAIQTSAGRLLIFRTTNSEEQHQWMNTINQAGYDRKKARLLTYKREHQHLLEALDASQSRLERLVVEIDKASDTVTTISTADAMAIFNSLIDAAKGVRATLELKS